MENTIDIKRNIFDILDNARTLFNEYYNGFDHDYTDEDKKIISALISLIEYDIDNIKDML
jgi:ribosomal protein S17E